MQPVVPLAPGALCVYRSLPRWIERREIEASSDEQMQSNDSVDPPNVVPRQCSPAELLQARTGDAAPIAHVPTRALEPAKKTQGFRAVDVMIALVALIVIGLSILGLTWLFRAP